MQKVAVVFDNKVRPDTTGVYCRRALGRLVDVEHFLSSDLSRLSRRAFDLYLRIDDGLDYRLPPGLRPCALWAIDTHLNYSSYLSRAGDFDFVFAAQRDGAERLRGDGISNCMWLPLACDPEIHRKHDLEKVRDVCFVGHLFSGPRAELLALIQKHFEGTFVGQRFFDDMAKTYSASRVVFNRSIRNDVNMRVFEGVACGSLLMTNDLAENGQDELFQDGVHLATYTDPEELIDKIRFYLEHEEVRERIAATGRRHALARHTYRDRMAEILQTVEKQSSAHSRSSALATGGNRAGLHATALPGAEAEEGSLGAAPDKSPEYGMTSIVILTCNQLPYTQLCLKSIQARTDQRYELIVIDNASSDGTVDYLRSLKGVKLIENLENRGFPAGCNQGIREASGHQVLLLNNDVIVSTGWLDRLLRALHSDPKIGLVGPCSNNVSGPQQIPVAYENLTQLDGFAREHGKANDQRYVETDRLVGFCLLIRRELIDKVGLLDERFGIGCFEDDDYCRRAIRAGYRAVIATDAFVHHFGSRSFAGNGVDLARILRDNEELFRTKWEKEGREDATPSASSAHSRSPVPWGVETARGGGLLLRPRHVLLSLCMIVRDNADIIEPCLSSVKPWVDEMIVVDTGSEDNTAELARQCGAEVREFPWCDDFAAARNESLRHATGEWIFWMDSDDTIDAENGRKLRQIAAGAHPASVLGYVMQVHCPGNGENGDSGTTVVDHVKLFRNRSDLRFEGRIHEQVLPSIRRAGGEVEFTDVFVEHSGADYSAEARRGKLVRDFRLLQLDLKDRPDHPFVLFNVGMTHADAGEHDQAVEALQRSIRVSQPSESHVRKAYALLVGSLSQLNRFDEAWQACEDGRRQFPDDAELLFREGVLHQHFGRPAEAEAAYRRILERRDERHFSSIDRGIRGFKTRHNLALAYEELNDLPRAEEQWRKAVDEEPNHRSGWQGLGDVLLRQGKVQAAEEQARRLQSDRLLDDSLRAEGLILQARTAACRGETGVAKQLFEEAVARWPDDLDSHRALCRFLFEHGEWAEAEQAVQGLLRRAPNDAASYHNLGTIYLQMGQHQEAVDALQASIQLRPDSPATRARLSQALEATGRTGTHASHSFDPSLAGAGSSR